MKEFLDWYYQQGFNLIPVPIGQKGTVIKWKQFQKKQAPQIPENCRSGGRNDGCTHEWGFGGCARRIQNNVNQ